jgi:hypothetical protein
MGMAPIVISGLLQGFGLGCTQVPLNIIALSTLPPHILTQGTAIRSLMRNLVLFALTLEDQSQVHREQHKMHRALHHIGSPTRERDDAYGQG